jgi:hypothetical protein
MYKRICIPELQVFNTRHVHGVEETCLAALFASRLLRLYDNSLLFPP